MTMATELRHRKTGAEAPDWATSALLLMWNENPLAGVFFLLNKAIGKQEQNKHSHNLRI